MERSRWFVEIEGKQYEADEATLQRWIQERRVTGEHRVKKGSLSWTEARLVPQLRDFFSQENDSAKGPTKAQILVTTGPVPGRYEIIDTVFALESSPEKVLRSDHVDEAFSKVLAAIRERCRSIGGDAVIYTQFEYRSAVDGIFGKAQVMEFFAYGTAVRILDSSTV